MLAHCNPQHRTIPLCVFPLLSQSDALLEAFARQVYDTPWFYRGSLLGPCRAPPLPPTPAPASGPAPPPGEARLVSQLSHMETLFSQQCGAAPRQLLAVSGNENFLALAKARGYLTCRYRPKDALYGQVRVRV